MPVPIATPTPTPSFDGDAYFANKTVTFITGTSPGGGYNFFARLVAETAENYFPDSTRFRVINKPGSGQYLGLEAVVDSDPDGLTVGLAHPRWIQREALIDDVPRFDLDSVYFLGSPTFGNRTSLCIDRNVATTWDEVLALGRPITVGGRQEDLPVEEFLARIGAPIDLIDLTGGLSSFDRGEIDAILCPSLNDIQGRFPHWITERKLVPLYYGGIPREPEYLRGIGFESDTYPGVTELPGFDIYASPLTALGFLKISDGAVRVFFLPERVPDDIASDWLRRFDQIMTDTQFAVETALGGYEVEYGTRQQVLEVIKGIRSLDDPTKSLLSDLTGVADLVF